MKIAEIFSSIQGEGKNQGKPCLFVRFAGCNLRCRWCDTAPTPSQSRGTELTIDHVLEQIWRKNPPYVCITGGEPLIQVGELETLLASLNKRGIRVDIETNGTLNFSRLQPYASICMDVKCPSSGEQSDLSLLSKIRMEDSVKFVVKDFDDCRYAQDVIDRYPIESEIFFSPVFGTDYAPIIDFILANNIQARFQIQLHKVIEVK